MTPRQAVPPGLSPPTFVLVHGAGFGPWAWSRTAEALAAKGASTVAVLLPAERQDATLDDYVSTVLATVADWERVVLVVHSLAGLIGPLIAARRPVEFLVYLNAFVPAPGRSLLDQLRTSPGMQPASVAGSLKRDEQDRLVLGPPEAVRHTFFHDCPEPTAQAAVRLLRPQGTKLFAERCPLPRHPDVRCASLVSRGDRVIGPAWSRAAATTVLGVAAVDIPGGHCPMLSRPQRLAEQLWTAWTAQQGDRQVGPRQRPQSVSTEEDE